MITERFRALDRAVVKYKLGKIALEHKAVAMRLG